MATAAPRIRVIVAEDHFVTRMGIKAVLAGDSCIELVGEADRGDSVVQLFAQLRPEVALIDLRLPGQSGVEAIKAIRADFPDARVLVLTSSDGSEDVYRALEAGARGYLLKDTSGATLVQAVRDVAAGRRVLPGDVAARLAERVPQSGLSAREVEVLRLAASGKSNKRIADALGLSEATVRTHMSHILAKLGADDRTHAATEALRRGIL